jgi:hypothetical protein
VFSVRYGLNAYILFRKNYVPKVLILTVILSAKINFKLSTSKSFEIIICGAKSSQTAFLK